MRREPRQPISYQKFSEEDYMMREFYECHVVKEEVPTKEEIFANARFFAIFSVEASKRGMEELADLMANRLDCYIWMLQKLGYRPGRAFVRRSISGLNEMLSSIFYIVRED